MCCIRNCLFDCFLKLKQGGASAKKSTLVEQIATSVEKSATSVQQNSTKERKGKERKLKEKKLKEII